MKKQTIFFDVGNVLVFFSHVKMIEKMANLYDSTFDKVLEFILAKNLQENYEVGKLTTNDVCSSLNNEFHKNTSTNELQKALNRKSDEIKEKEKVKAQKKLMKEQKASFCARDSSADTRE